MENTVHAHQRILERTKLRDEDVLWIIRNNLFVDLGFFEGRQFVCFYSPPDQRSKIAVVSSGEPRVLISILEEEFHLPKTVKKVDRKVSTLAMLKLFDHVEQMKKKDKDTPANKNRRIKSGTVSIHVEEGGAEVFSQKYKFEMWDISATKDEVFVILQDKIRTLWEVVDSSGKSVGHVRYRVIFRPGLSGQFRNNFVFEHLMLKKIFL